MSLLKSKFFRTGTVGAVLSASALMAAPAYAGAITFNYDCVVASATSCTTGGGPYGTITLTDSIVDANRVDIDITLNGPNILAKQANFTGLDNFFLNYNGPIPGGTTFKMTLQTDPAGSFANTGGDVNVNLNNQGPLSTTLDFLLNPTGSVPSLTFSGSLVLFLSNSPHTETNLDVSMFDLMDANNLLYSAFNSMGNPSFNGGALSKAAAATTSAVPEPFTLSLFGAGLTGLAVVRRRRAKKS